MNRQTTIVIPCYNEAERLPVGELLDFAKKHDNIFFIMVNDGSTDNTAAIINHLCDILPNKISAIHLPHNVGKGEAVRAGLMESIQIKSDYTGFLDADLSTPLKEIDRLISILQNKSKVEAVFGARVQLLGRNINRKPQRHYIGRIFATIFSLILRLPVYDTQCGAKVFRITPKFRRIISEKFITRWLFDVEIIARFFKYSEKDTNASPLIYEEPLLEWQHMQGSKIGINNFFQILSETYKLWKNYKKKTP